MQRYEEWEHFRTKKKADKLSFFKRNGRLFDILYTQQFDKEFLAHLFRISDRIRTIAKTQKGLNFLRTTLSDKRAMLFFVQPSTRTFMSFLNACHILGIQTSEIRDTSTSSEIKGESPEDSIRVFSSYVDMIITRHHNEGFAEKSAWVLNTCADRSVPVINGGSGKDQHPTQALLDIYTISRAFADMGGIENKTFTMIGDLKRGRTVRSLCYLLALYRDVKFYFVSPPEFAMQQDVLDFLDSKKIPYVVTDDFTTSITQADGIYATRLQDEYDSPNESKYIDFDRFNLTAEHLPLLKKHCIIMHPLPRRNEISVEIDRDPRALYWKQVRNGMWVRAALMLYLFERDTLIDDYVA
jgi:aspartate carbamoyltransferase catalytic subunit